jgi:hypothetical protein
MSEAQTRPARGRSSARGGRASYGSRGPRKTNGDSASSNIDTSADQGELGELKKRYQSQLSTLKELFPSLYQDYPQKDRPTPPNLQEMIENCTKFSIFLLKFFAELFLVSKIYLISSHFFQRAWSPLESDPNCTPSLYETTNFINMQNTKQIY